MEKVKQIDINLKINDDFDEVITSKEEFNNLFNNFNFKSRFTNWNISKNDFWLEKNNKRVNILTKSVTYLGNPHPKSKKRIQIPKSFFDKCKDNYNLGIETMILGIYKYKDNVIFVDFDINDFLNETRKPNNSSAHVNINDLYLGQKENIFNKIDNKGNHISIINRNYIMEYLENKYFNSIKVSNSNINEIIKVFDDFNRNYFDFNKEIFVLDAIEEMHKENSQDFAQAEWFGFYLEHLFKKFLKSKNQENNKVEFIGKNNKSSKIPKTLNNLDFDLKIKEYNDFYYGDLKASDSTKIIAPWNDKISLETALENHGRFLLVIYEAEVIKAKDIEEGKKINQDRIKLISNLKSKELEKDDNSYFNRLKAYVKFKECSIIYIDKEVFDSTKIEFKQGKQQTSGKERKLKLNIKKKKMKELAGVYFFYSK